MSLNQRSRQRLDEGTNLIQNALLTYPKFSVSFATHLLREEGVYNQVRSITINRIGVQGVKEGIFGFDASHGFWRTEDVVGAGVVEPPVLSDAPRYMRDYIDQWVTETCDIDVDVADDKRQAGILTNRVITALNLLCDPDVSQDAVMLAQVLNGYFDRDNQNQWAVLGSFRSFVRWGVDKGLMTGNLNLLWVPDELADGVRRGVFHAVIAAGTMTNLKNQWTWRVFGQEGEETPFVGTPEEINIHLRDLNAASMDDESIDFDDVLNVQGVPNTDYYDPEILLGGTTESTDQFADAGSSIPDELLNRIMDTYSNSSPDQVRVTDSSNESVSIPRPIAERIAKICKELQGLINTYL